MTYGFQQPEIKPEDYKFGALPREQLTLGDWRPFLPVFEHQRKRTETQACVSFGTNSALEMIHKAKWGVEPNYSDRFLAKVSKTTRTGNTPNKVSQALRDNGAVKEEIWAFDPDMDWDEFYTEIPKSVLAKGLWWLENYDFGYEWVDGDEIREALQYSPVGVAVYAWDKREGVYIQNRQPNHWCVLVAYEDGFPIIWDSYEENLKKLPKDFSPKWAMRYSLYKKDPSKREHWLVGFIKKLLCR